MEDKARRRSSVDSNAAPDLVAYFNYLADEADKEAARLWTYQMLARANYFEGMRDAYRIAASRFKREVKRG